MLQPAESSWIEPLVLALYRPAVQLATLLVRDYTMAQDIVQEACLRAFKFIDTFRAGNSRAWFLSIVRNTYYSDLKKNRAQAM